MSIYRHWRLCQAPLPCKKSMLTYIHITFKDDEVFLSDTSENGGSGQFTIDDNTITIGKVYWTQIGRVWKDPAMRQEAALLDNFLSHLLNKPFTFEVTKTMLIIYCNDGVYYFKEIN